MRQASSLSDQAIQDATLLLSEEAMRSYVDLSIGRRGFEGFIQTFCALELQNRYNRRVITEPPRSYLKWRFPHSASNIDQIRVDIAKTRFKLDLLVFDPPPDHISEASLRAIIEFKQDAKPAKIKTDIGRTSALLSALADEPTPTQGNRFGLQLLCTMYANEEGPQADIKNMEDIAADLGLRIRPPVTFCISVGTSQLYCVVIGIPLTGKLR